MHQSESAKQSPTNLTSPNILAKSYRLWRSNLPSLLHLSLVWLVLPQFAMYIFTSIVAKGVTNGLWSLTNYNHNDYQLTFDNFASEIQEFGIPFISLWILCLVCFCFAYGAMTLANLEILKQKKIQRAFLYARSIKCTFKIFLLLSLIQISFLIGMQFILLHIILIVLASIAPVILISEQKGVFKSFLSSLNLNYADKAKYSGISLFLSLGGVFSVIYLIFQLLFFLCSQIPTLDFSTGMPMSIMNSSIASVPFFQIIYFLLSSLLFALCTTFISCISVIFYDLTRKKLLQFH